MKTDGQSFLDALATLPPDTFESRFSRVAIKIGLGANLDRNELKLLYEAARCAKLCRLALNGLDTSERKIRPEREKSRTRLERDFMIARDMFWASPGGQGIFETKREVIEHHLLRVFVAERNLAW